MESLHGTTILAVRRHGKVVIGGDGQVTLGNTVMKGNARKVRRIFDGKVLTGFAGATADAFTLFDKFEVKLKEFNGDLTRAAVELAKYLCLIGSANANTGIFYREGNHVFLSSRGNSNAALFGIFNGICNEVL